ncbi:hypothetical protein MES4922_190223 [Mesorhizobium ventifaucium]|uniref:Uncharacterized protein n=1 Tax=Mesorhizobium ventifaucium TaxID=666020 RepID=A0ABM9DLI3_9HYPH|nr:hypothetical protein MES4922_190223 [Mesorhizobium ventifaucium]
MQRRCDRPDDVIADKDRQHENGEAEDERIDRPAGQRVRGVARRTGAAWSRGQILHGETDGGGRLVELVKGFLQGMVHHAIPFGLLAGDLGAASFLDAAAFFGAAGFSAAAGFAGSLEAIITAGLPTKAGCTT